MIDYRTVVKGELAAHEMAVAILDENEPLDAQDGQRRGEELAVCSALTCVLRAFEEAESAALDVLYAEHLRRSQESANRAEAERNRQDVLDADFERSAARHYPMQDIG